MHSIRHDRSLFALILYALLIVVLAAPAAAPTAAQSDTRVSRPGEYQGYSEMLYDGWVRTSQYVAVRDGTRLAVDIFRPTLKGAVVEDPLPVIWTHDRYHRANLDENGNVVSLVDRTPGLATIIEYGYVVGVVDVRGGGASFGTRRGEFSPEETRDAYDMTEWFAAQPWSTGNIGMFGLSYLAITQYMAASTQPPHLKAIFPMMAMFDMYGFVYPNGVFHQNFVYTWGAGNILLDKVRAAAPVDDDPNGVLLHQAMAEHKDNWNIYTIASESPFRDSIGPEDTPIYSVFSPSTYLDQINASGVAIYTLAGWYDMYPRDALEWFNNLTVPQKLLITPWSHNGTGGFDIIAEHLRWFDYWLKGIDNGIMDEPPITYIVMGASGDRLWRTADSWPLPEAVSTPFYLDAGPSGSARSVNDRLLSQTTPADAAQDDFTVDYSATTGMTTRWTDGYGGGFGYSDMASNDAKGMTYTTPPLEADMEVVGSPIADLWVSVNATDADVIVYLEEIDPRGHSVYISEGVMRASYRALSDAPFNTFGLPYHSGLQADVAPLTPGEPVELTFDLLPTGNVFNAGNRLRITIQGADKDTYGTPQQTPPPVISVYRGADHASYIDLPLIPAQ